MTSRARVYQLSVSAGGVPKRPVESAEVTRLGLAGDAQHDTKHHGGPDRAVCVYSLEVIRAVQAEGHPIHPGTTGENVTVEGLEWAAVAPGSRLLFEGGVELEVTSYTTPCSTIRESFRDLKFRRIGQEEHPGQSRVYARVIAGGTLRRGEGVRHVPATGAAWTGTSAQK